MTPTLPTRAALRGMSGSYYLDCFIGLDGGDDRLDGDPSVGDQLAARAPRCGREWRGPQVLPDEHAGGAARVHAGGEVLDIFLRQELGQFGLERFQLAEFADIG